MTTYAETTYAESVIDSSFDIEDYSTVVPSETGTVKEFGVQTSKGSFASTVNARDNAAQRNNPSVNMKNFVQWYDSYPHKYLEPRFDPSSLRPKNIRHILRTHGITPHPEATKAQLLQLLKNQVLSRAEKLMEEIRASKGQPSLRTGKVGCEHKIVSNCQLSNIDVCCACADERPMSEEYELYQMGRV
jgi:hypothetical protein